MHKLLAVFILGWVLSSLGFCQTMVRTSSVAAARIADLNKLLQTNIPKQSVNRSASGDVLVCAESGYRTVFAKETAALSSLLLREELVALLKASPGGQTFRFDQLSDISQKTLTRSMQKRLPQHIPAAFSRFTLRVGLGTTLSSGSQRANLSLSPGLPKKSMTEPNPEEDRVLASLKQGVLKQNQNKTDTTVIDQSLNDVLAWPELGASVPDLLGFSACQRDLAVWVRNMNQLLDSQIERSAASGGNWEKYRQARTARTVEELKVLAPDVHHIMAETYTDLFGTQMMPSDISIQFQYQFSILVLAEGAKKTTTIKIL